MISNENSVQLQWVRCTSYTTIIRVREMRPLRTYLVCVHEFNPKNTHKNLDMCESHLSPKFQVAKTRGSQSSLTNYLSLHNELQVIKIDPVSTNDIDSS